MRYKSIILHSTVFFIFALLGLLTLQIKTPLILSVQAALQPQAVQLYHAQPQPYDYKVESPYYDCPWCSSNPPIRNQDKGQTFTNNLNPWPFEVYQCDSKGGSILARHRNGRRLPTDFYTKRSTDICIPQAITINGIKRWPQGIYPNSSRSDMECFDIQHLLDGPHQSTDNRALNGTGQPNSQLDICTQVVGQPGANPYLSITTPFSYQPFMCQHGNKVVLAGRQDPANPECAALNITDVMTNPWRYSSSQLSCFLYFDDLADVTACKGGNCKSIRLQNSMNGIYPAPQPSQSLCSLFNRGAGEYQVNIKVYDAGTEVYGTGDLWLTWKDNACTATPATNLQAPRLQSNEATLTWTSGTGGNKQWVMIDTNKNKVENNCAGGCLVNDRGLWGDQQTYTFGQPKIAADTTYYWKVMEVDTGTPNCQAESAIATFTTPKACFAPRSVLYVKGPGESLFGAKSDGQSESFVGDQLKYYPASTGSGGNIDFWRNFGSRNPNQRGVWQYHEFTTTIPANFKHYGGHFYAAVHAGGWPGNKVSTIYADDIKVEVWDPQGQRWEEITLNSGFEQGSNGAIPAGWKNNSWLADFDNYKTGAMDGVSPKSGSAMLRVHVEREWGHHGSEVVQTFTQDLRGKRVKMSGWLYRKRGNLGQSWHGGGSFGLAYWNVEGGDIEKISFGVDGNLQEYPVPVPQPPEPRRSDRVRPDQNFTGTGTHTITYYAKDSCEAQEAEKTYTFTLNSATCSITASNTSIDEGDSVDFSATDSGFTGTKTYGWNFGDCSANPSSSCTLSGGNSSPSHTYDGNISSDQSFNVSLTISDSNGNSANCNPTTVNVNAFDPISGTVWEDRNQNNQCNDDETQGYGLGGATINISGADSDTQTTNGNGNYSTKELNTDGIYTVSASKSGYLSVDEGDYPNPRGLLRGGADNIDFCLSLNPPAWFQVTDGDVYGGGISVDIPPGKYFMTGFQPPDSVGALLSNSPISINSSRLQEGRSNPWLDDGYSVAAPSYSDFRDIYATRIQNNSDVIEPALTGGKLTASNSHTSKVVFVNGDLEFDSNFTPGPAVFFVQGTTTITKNVANTINAAIISGRDIIIEESPNDAILKITGMAVSLGGNIQVKRTKNNNQNPAVKFIYDPSYLIDFTDKLGRSRISWQEIAP